MSYELGIEVFILVSKPLLGYHYFRGQRTTRTFGNQLKRELYSVTGHIERNAMEPGYFDKTNHPAAKAALCLYTLCLI
jgi:hypothetical protein